MQRRLSTANFSALVGGGLVLFCAAIFVSGLHIKAREASPSVTVEGIPVMPGLDAEDEAAMAAAAGIEPEPETEPERIDDGGAVIEVAPQEPATTVSAPVETVPEGWKEKLLYRPAPTAGGSFQAQGYKITLAGLEPLALNEKCKGADGQDWFCGAAARTQFGSYLRGRALTCTVPDAAPQDTIETTCSISGDDIGTWLAAHGWARVADGGPLAEAGEKARSERLGIWGNKPALPPVVIGEVPTDPLAPSPSIVTAPIPALSGQSPSITTQRQGNFPPAPTLQAQ